MDKKQGVIVSLILLLCAMPTKAQQFNYNYNGTTITYRITSVPKHEVEVRYVPEDVTAVTIPAVVYFNDESFKVTTIGDGGSRSGGWFSSYEGDGYYSFMNCNLLKTVVLPNTIKKIGDRAFYGCSWLRHINLPSGLIFVDDDAFKGCESLSSLTLPSSTRRIGSNAFNGCNGPIYLSANIDTIEYCAFGNCKFVLPEKLGFVLNNTVVITSSNKDISSSAFGNSYNIIEQSEFINNVLASPTTYLQASVGKPWASIVKKALIDAGKYDEVLVYYPNDSEVQDLQRAAEIKRLVRQGDSEWNRGNFANAKLLFEQALVLAPNDKTIIDRISEVEEDIAEQERQRIAAEIQARREMEEIHVRKYVDFNALLANQDIKRGLLQKASEQLQQALDTAVAHNYNYRTFELTQRIDSIRQVQATIADTSKIIDYSLFRPDLYKATQDALKLKIRSYLIGNKKNVKSNNISVTIYTSNQPGCFHLTESSHTLKKLCQELLNTTTLQPLVIDDRPLRASATYNYNIEHVSGTVNVRLDENKMWVKPKFNLSSPLESDLKRVFQLKLGALPSSCNGSYTFKVSSMNIGDQMEHDIKLKSLRCKNGPQNAWRSLLIPFWGDKYVGGGIFGSEILGLMGREINNTWWMWSLTCYTAIGVGIYSLTNGKESNNTYNESSYMLIAAGAALWLGDVISVWIKGAKNKKECKDMINRISFAYDATQNAPELVYSLRF